LKSRLAGLTDLKIAMVTSVFIAAFIFTLFLSAIMFLLQLPLVYALIGTILFIFFQYLVGPVVLRSTTQLHYVEPNENQWLESLVKELAKKSNIPIPKLAIVPNSTPNAFVFGRTAKEATLAVHEGLLKNLNAEEVRAVLAHEIGHIKHKDYIVMTVLSALPLIAYMIAQVAFRTAMWGSYSRRKKDENGGIVLLAVGMIAFVVYLISFLSVMRLSRLREHYADAYSAYLTGSPRSLQSALAKITYGLSISPKPPEGARAFYIEDPAMAKEEIHQIMAKKQEYDLDKDGVLDEHELELAMEKEAKSTWKTINSWFATHPPTFKRILLLRQIEAELATGEYTAREIYAHI
jgi:heat shock protein HtpX